MRSPRSLDPRLLRDCIQVDTTTGHFVVLEQIHDQRVSVTDLGPRSVIGTPLSLSEWLSDRFRLPTNRDRVAFGAHMYVHPNH